MYAVAMGFYNVFADGKAKAAAAFINAAAIISAVKTFKYP
jgi:hypothetical protein